MPLGKRQNPRPRPPLVSARFSVLFCAAHVPLSRQQRLCFTLAQPQGLRTATPFHLSRILGSLPAELTPNRIPSISSWKPLLTLLTGSDHPIRSERRGPLHLIINFSHSMCYSCGFKSEHGEHKMGVYFLKCIAFTENCNPSPRRARDSKFSFLL